jgi:cysteine desulfurase
MENYLFFDNASTTKCCEAAAELVRRYALEDFGNPSSSHALGQQAAKAIRDARVFFAKTFNVNPEQIIFTGSGSEADNLAVYGVALDAIARRKATRPRVIVSAIEHPAVRKTAQSLAGLGVDVQLAPVGRDGQLVREKYLELLTPETVLVSVHRVNNIVGSILPVEELARVAKERVPGVIFHTDAVQAFGRVDVPTHPSPVDLVSVSAHKVEGPKGVGALIVLDRALLKTGLRPLVWGGDQEGGFRSGTQNAGLIAGFAAAAEQTLRNRADHTDHARKLRDRLRDRLAGLRLLDTAESDKGRVRWNSPEAGVPHIVSLSVPGFPSGPLAKLLEERRCLVSTGSACSSQKMEPDPVLSSMGFPPPVHSSAIRVSFSRCNHLEDVDTLAAALDESIRLMNRLLKGA